MLSGLFGKKEEKKKDEVVNEQVSVGVNKTEDGCLGESENKPDQSISENVTINKGDENKESSTVRVNVLLPRIRGNDYCPCGSNKKFKKCCSKDDEKIKMFSKKFNIRLITDKEEKKKIREEKKKIRDGKKTEQ